MTAIELLTAHWGEGAEQYTPCFRYAAERKIVSIEIYAVGMDNTTARYSGRDEPGAEVNNLLRIKTADGCEGVSGVDTCYLGQHSDELLRELLDMESPEIAHLRDSGVI